MFETGPDAIPSRINLLTTWLPRIAIAAIFVSEGWAKFRDPFWVRLFGQIGLGQWFRALTGLIEIGGGLMVLIPGLTLIGLALLACTMAGATIAWITVLHAPANVPIPAALFAALIAMAYSEYTR